MNRFALVVISFFLAFTAFAADTKPGLNDETFAGRKMRSIGPAFMSGRIADIAVDPDNPNIWYIGVASGGVWKTTNSGTTFDPIFDSQSSYSDWLRHD